MDRSFSKVNQGRVDLEYVADDISAHYFLAGDLFRVENEILKLMNHYDGVCTENISAHSTTLDCDFNCIHCNRSIYALVKKKERFFKQRCIGLCTRYPKEGDEWEISLVSKDGIHPRYRNYFFRCTEKILEKNIIELLFEALDEVYTDGYYNTNLCFVKIKRFDMPRALDVSLVANRYIQALIKGEPMSSVVIDID